MGEKHKRTITKTISWRIIATGTTMTLVFLYTGEIAASLGIGALEATLKMLFYYGHERTWDKVQWGRLSKSL